MADRQVYKKPLLAERSPYDFQHIRLAVVIHAYFDQSSSEPLYTLLEQYSHYDTKLLDEVHFVIIDDYSHPDVQARDFGLTASWARVTTNIMWNQGGARNLGVTLARCDKVIVCDLDMSIPELTMQHLVRRKSPGKIMYKFWRQNSDGTFARPHPNAFFFSRSRFMKYFGYDEEYSGGYGAEDYRFVKWQKAQGTVFRKLAKRYVLKNRTTIDRATEYHSLSRNFERNTPLDNRKRNESITYGRLAGHSRMFLNFDYERTAFFARPVKSTPEVNKCWKKLWLIRQLQSLLCPNN